MAETTTPVNLLFKYGDFSKLSSTIDQGTIYFAKDDITDHENNKGYIYYGDPISGAKNSIIGDGYFLKNNNQFFINRSILNIGTNDIYLQQDGASLIVNGLRISKNPSNIELSNDILIDGQLSLKGHFLPQLSSTYDLGANGTAWQNIYGNNIYGELTGNASTATKLVNSVNINGTAFDGSSDITTTNWGTSRTITIKDSDLINKGTGVDINGSKNYTLTLPSTIKATLTGNADTATKLKTARTIRIHGEEYDFDGSSNLKFVIRDASATQSGVVSTGSQTFKGNKTFSGDLTVEGSVCNFEISGSHISISNSNVNQGRGMLAVANVKTIDSTNGDRAIFLQSHTDNYKAQVVLVSAGTKSAFYPNYIKTPSTGVDEVENGILNLGLSGRAWKNIYAQHDAIKPSDIRLKDIQDSYYLNSLINVYDSLTPIAYKMKNTEKDNTHDRIHIGLSSQEVEEKMIENGLTRLDFGGLCIDPIYDEDGKLIDESYGLRYGEFHGLHILKNHQQDERITNLENQIANLKTQLELLKLSIGG